jgi:hypothetical protein
MAEVHHETANASIENRSDVDDKPALSKFWLGEISASKKRDKSWHRRADKVIERYRDERNMDRQAEAAERRANILWSNTETLKSALFSGLGNPDVRRRFPKKGQDDKAARQAALSLERGLSYCSDAYDAESQIDAIIEDYLLPGRGAGWLVYEANVYEGGAEEDEGPEQAAPATPEVTDQAVRIDHVFWKDFLTSAGRKWSDVWWVARGHDYSRDELKRYWPKHAEDIPLNVSVAGFDETKKGKSKEQEDTFKRARIWEVWDKSKKERVYVAEDYDFVLETTPDPYRLKDFYPTVEPLYAVKTTSTLTPIPEYTLYQDQAEELDILQTRLCRITDALKRRGVYDASMEGGDNQLSQLAYAGDNQFIGVRNFAALMEKGGLKNIFQTEDLSPFVVVLQGLSEREQALLQKIYEITGISDILRGASDPNETATAQKIKGQFGSLRLQKRQKRIQTFIRDFFRLKAEIIAEHFTREQLVEMTGIDMPLQAEKQQAQMMLQAIQQREAQAKQMAQQGQGAVAAPPPVPPEVMQQLTETIKAVTWEEIAAILRSDKRRGYKVDIETDATNALDSETEKAQRIEFITAMGTMLEKALPMIAQAPPQAAAPLMTLMKENSMFAAAAFKAGRTMEEAYEDAFTKLEDLAKAQANAPPKPSPEEAKLQAEMKAKEADLQFQQQSKQMEFQFKEKEAAQSAQLEQQKMQHQAQLEEKKLQHTMQLETMKAQNEAQLAQAKMQQEAQLSQYQAENDMQMRAREFDANQAMQQQQFAFDTEAKQHEAGLKEREFGHKQQLETGKLEFERENAASQMAFQQEQSDREFMAQGQTPGADGRPTGGVAALAQSVSEAAQQMKEALAQMAAFQAEFAQFQDRSRQPKRFVRGADGRATHVQTGHGTFPIERGPDGRAIGLM